MQPNKELRIPKINVATTMLYICCSNVVNATKLNFWINHWNYNCKVSFFQKLKLFSFCIKYNLSNIVCATLWQCCQHNVAAILRQQYCHNIKKKRCNGAGKYVTCDVTKSIETILRVLNCSNGITTMLWKQHWNHVGEQHCDDVNGNNIATMLWEQHCGDVVGTTLWRCCGNYIVTMLWEQHCRNVVTKTLGQCCSSNIAISEDAKRPKVIALGPMTLKALIWPRPVALTFVWFDIDIVHL